MEIKTVKFEKVGQSIYGVLINKEIASINYPSHGTVIILRILDENKIVNEVFLNSRFINQIDMIQPGEKIHIRHAGFIPVGMTGHFKKNIIVYRNADTSIDLSDLVNIATK